MLGTLVNVLAIAAGTMLGLLFRRGIPERARQTLFQAIGLAVILIGLKMGFSAENELLVIVSLVLGGVVGEALRIDRHLDRLGERLRTLSGSRDGLFIEGFVTASLIFTIGAMAVMGALESGLTGNHQILFAKSALDGITALLLASSFGVGVLFAALPVFLYQGGITLLAGGLRPVLTGEIVGMMTATGGLLILAIGIGMVMDRRLRVVNLLPSLAVAVAVGALAVRFGWPV